MDIEKIDGKLVINLTSGEVFAVQEGRIVGERGGLTPEAKVEVLPLSAIKEDDTAQYRMAVDRQERALIAPVEAILLTNDDLRIIIPNVVLSDVRVSSRTIASGEVVIIGGNEEQREILPSDGIQINFGGSVKVIDLSLLMA